MRSASLSQVQQHLPAYLAQCEKVGPLLITRKGKPIGVLAAPASDEQASRLKVNPPKTLEDVLRRAEANIAKGRLLTMDELRARLGVPRKRTARRAKSGSRSGGK
jgi:PHD/YefM family antitoxin component YafN of YafNO toxin-antitoxin module